MNYLVIYYILISYSIYISDFVRNDNTYLII